MSRTYIEKEVVVSILTGSRRRCALCFGLEGDSGVKKGQIAHIDHDSSNPLEDNLVFMCLPHHDEYDSKTSQSKGITEDEAKHYKDLLLAHVKDEMKVIPQDYELSSDIDSTVDRPQLSPYEYGQRIVVYRAAKSFILSIIGKADVTREELQAYGEQTDEAIFLFDQEISEYLRALYSRAVELRFVQQKLSSPARIKEPDFDVLLDQDEELLLWFTQQLEELRSKMYPYIGLAKGM